MKYYISTTEFNCGIDLHARQLYVCLMDQKKLRNGVAHCRFHPERRGLGFCPP
jgi:hypothetical protein